MCAIFGYVSRGDDRVSIKTLAAIVRANINRGPHSFGLAWIDRNNRLHCFKQRGRMTDYLGVLAMVRDARMFIGHLRFATHGDPRDNINNHPHPVDGGWLVHNGVVSNYCELVKHGQLNPNSECDSEALGLLIEQSSEQTLMARCAESIQLSDGGLCVMGLWSRPGSLIVARRGNPLHLSEVTGGVYIATVAQGLPGRPSAITDNSIRLFRRNLRGISVRRQRLRSLVTAAGPLFDEDGDYAGG